MRSGWPHTQDNQGRLSADQRPAPFGPDISWPTGYSNLEYRDGDYRYPAPQPVNHGEHPYAASSTDGYGDAGGYPRPSADFGYGDPGYSDPRYDGPASQDVGIPGTRTVRGYVEPGRAQPGYALPAAPGPGYAPNGYEYAPPGYGESGQIELAYPIPSREQEAYPEDYQAADTYRQPWDYDQPLRYEGDGQAAGGYGRQGGYQDSGGYGPSGYGAGEYNGSDLSRPGIDGPGYDLSGIIETGDFQAVGYDEPSYDRLSYDDPRYADAPGGNPGTRFDDTLYDMPRYDDTRLDSLWLPSEGAMQDESIGYGNDGFDAGGPLRSGYSDRGFDGGTNWPRQLPAARPSGPRLDETRFDLRAADVRMDNTRFDGPAFNQTRTDLRALPSGLSQSATGLLPPLERQPLNWPDETSFDAFTGPDVADEPVRQLPPAFTRPAERQDEAAMRRAAGRRRGRSGDRRQWMALGAIAVVAAGAIGGVLMKYVFAGPSGPAHTVVAPNQAGAFTRMPNLEKQMKVDALRAQVIKTTADASDVQSAVYQEGSSAPGGDAQVFMFVGGKLSGAEPAASIANFTQTYPGATSVPAGALGGEAACGSETTSGGESVAMCVWYDNDTFGELVSATMTPQKLASTLDTVRPNLELYAK